MVRCTWLRTTLPTAADDVAHGRVQRCPRPRATHQTALRRDIQLMASVSRCGSYVPFSGRHRQSGIRLKEHQRHLSLRREHRSVPLRMRFGTMRADFLYQFFPWQLRVDAPEFADCKTLAIFCMKLNSVNGNVAVISDILRNFTAIIFKIYSRISSSKSTLLSTRQKLWLLTNYPMSMGRLCSTSASNPLPCRR